MLGVSQCLGLGHSQVGIVTRILTVAACRQVALMFGEGCLFRLLWSEFRVIALIPAIRAILSVALAFGGDGLLCLDSSQLGLITWSRAVCTVRRIELAPRGIHFLSFCWSQFRSVAPTPSILASCEIALLLRCGD